MKVKPNFKSPRFHLGSGSKDSPAYDDDYSSDIYTTGRVDVGGQATGNLQGDYDTDWFRVSLNANAQYILRQTKITIDDPYLELYDSSGNDITYDDDSDGERNSKIIYTPATSGNYFLAAGSYYDLDLGTYSVSVSSSDTTPPVVNLRSVSGSTLIMTLNETLKSTVPDSARFAVHVNGATRSVISRSVNTTGRTVTLGLATPVTAGQAVTLAYTDKTSGNDTTGVIEDVAGNDLRTFTATTVTNNTPPATPWWNGGRFSELWGFSQPSDKDIDASEIFATWGGPSSGIPNLSAGQNKVAVLDTGIRGTHQDLAANYVGGYDFVYGDGDPNDVQGHGTHVAGTIGAVANSVGVVGANPAAKLLAVKVLGDSGSGSISGIISGINYAVQQGSKILNMSLGGTGFSQAFFDALAAAGNAGCLTIAAAGNETKNNDGPNPSYPASYTLPSIVSVGASTNTDWYADFSNWGLNSVDLYAPGKDILSTVNSSDSGYGYKNGTSMAAPLVAGVVSAYWARNPNLTAAQVKARLLSTVDPLSFPKDTVTGGRMNMSKMFGLSSSSIDPASTKVDPVTGVSTLRALSGTGEQAESSNYYSAADIDLIDIKTFEPTDNIILFLTGKHSHRVANSSSIDSAVSRNDSQYSAFDNFESLSSLGAGLGVLTVDSSASGSLVLAGLQNMMDKGLISGFELDGQMSAI